MCKNGTNISQFENALCMLDDHVALEYRWTHKLAHSAGDSGFCTTSEKLHRAQVMLAEIRSLFDEAKSALDDDVVNYAKEAPEVRLV